MYTCSLILEIPLYNMLIFPLEIQKPAFELWKDFLIIKGAFSNVPCIKVYKQILSDEKNHSKYIPNFRINLQEHIS